ncbi:ABC transporter ATP-binding protein [Euryarchaeota archaeon]|nr:ABC transporter ATP-binding protein [Euryarchaeota archaeon]
MASSLLELVEVQKDYRIRSFGRVVRTTKALDKLSLKVEKGQIFGFLGPNGAGKTTTIKCITGILESDSGSIKIEGEDIGNNSFENKNKIGFLPEQIGLYGNLNCIETLSFYAGFYDLKAETIEKRSLELLGLLGLGKDAERPVGEFSLGMKKRLALAIALLHEPQILILDEPTSGLDPRGVKALRSVLRDLNTKGLTILLSSHVLSEVQEICTHVGIINNGKLIKQESIQKIREKVRKTAIRLSLRVKNFNKKNEDELIKKNGISIIEKNDLGKHQQIILTLKEKLIPWVTDNLVKNDVQIFSIEPQDTSLEDVFMTETGGENED